MFYLIRPMQSDIETLQTQVAAVEALQASAKIKTKVHAISATPTGSEQDTLFDFPAKSVVLGVWLEVTTAEVTGTTKTMDIGLKSSESGGDADGFLNGVGCTSVGIKKGTLLNTNQTLGAFMCVDEDGAGALVPESHVIATARSLTFTAGSADWAEFRGNIVAAYVELA